MTELRTKVLSTRPAGRTVPQLQAASRSAADHVGRMIETSGPSGTGRTSGGHGEGSREPLAPRRGAAGRGGYMASDEDLLERTLAFSGSYVSDDGNVTVRRIVAPTFEYSGHRFVAHCSVCSRAGLVPLTGEPLPDVRAAILFVAAHDHGESD
jgi:hypothetical protein